MVVLGVVVMAVGLVLFWQNARAGAWLHRVSGGRSAGWDRILEHPLYRPTTSGGLPLLTIVSLGWVVVGFACVRVGLGG